MSGLEEQIRKTREIGQQQYELSRQQAAWVSYRDAVNTAHLRIMSEMACSEGMANQPQYIQPRKQVKSHPSIGPWGCAKCGKLGYVLHCGSCRAKMGLKF